MNFSAITNSLIENIGSYYNFKQVSIIDKLRGVGGSNFIIKADSVDLFLKLYNHCDDNKINKIDAITQFLFSKAIPVILPIKNKDNLFHTSIENMIFSLYPQIHNDIPQRLSSKCFKSIARVIASLHNLGKQCPLNLSHTVDSIVPVSQIIQKMNQMNSLVNEQQLNAKLEYLPEKLIAIKIDILNCFKSENLIVPLLKEKSLVHGDFHIENLLFNSDQEVSYILDFDCIHFGYGVEDVMLFILYRLFNENCSKQAFQDMRFFLSSYLSICPLDISEIKFGINYTLFKLVSSTFLEEKLCKTKDSNLAKHFDWSLKIICYLRDNKNKLLISLLNNDIREF